MKLFIKMFVSIIISLTATKSILAADYNFKFGTVSADTEPLLDAMRYMAKKYRRKIRG